MSQSQIQATELTSHYISQVTGDLERNAKEQERIGADIEALQEQLHALRHDHTVLVSMQQALGGSGTAGVADVTAVLPAAQELTTAVPSVPQQTSVESKRSRARKAVGTSAKKTAPRKPEAKKPEVGKPEPKKAEAKKPEPKKAEVGKPEAKAAKAAAQPTLVELIRGHLEQQSEPRSAAEISAALTQTHPDRSIKITVVRTTLEGLVAKSHAHRTKQGTSVFYTPATASTPAAAEPKPEASAG